MHIRMDLLNVDLWWVVFQYKNNPSPLLPACPAVHRTMRARTPAAFALQPMRPFVPWPNLCASVRCTHVCKCVISFFSIINVSCRSTWNQRHPTDKSTHANAHKNYTRTHPPRHGIGGECSSLGSICDKWAVYSFDCPGFVFLSLYEVVEHTLCLIVIANCGPERHFGCIVSFLVLHALQARKFLLDQLDAAILPCGPAAIAQLAWGYRSRVADHGYVTSDLNLFCAVEGEEQWMHW